MTTRMIQKLALAVCLFASASCDSAAEEPTFTTEIVAEDVAYGLTTVEVGARGFAQALASSRFAPGDGMRTEGNAYLRRVVGDKGSFVTNLLTGASAAMLHSVVPSAMKRPLSDPEEHNRRARDYFESAGLPREQIGDVTITTKMAGGGELIDPNTAYRSTKLVSYTSHLKRVVDGIPVVGSVALVSFAEDGTVLREMVFWPEIASDVLARARGLTRTLQEPAARNAYVQRIKARWPDADGDHVTVEIVHGPGTGRERAQVRAVSAFGRIAAAGKPGTRYFDDDANPVVVAEHGPRESAARPRSAAP